MKLKHLLTLAAIGSALAASVSLASAPAGSMTADAALASLMEGNARFVQSQMTGQSKCNSEARASLATSQKPYAIILSCSDSRVPPELIFDKGLGELFIIRVAGNVPDPIVLGSIEYAAEHLGTPLVMVLGHERCGAVTATVTAKGKPEGNIGAIVKAISPAVKKAKAECKTKEQAQLVECSVDQNAKLVAAGLTKQSKVLEHLVKEGKLRIVSAKYDLDDGKVTVFDK